MWPKELLPPRLAFVLSPTRQAFVDLNMVFVAWAFLMKRFLELVVLCCGAILALSTTLAFADVRIKDITDLEGARSNQLIGMGLVVGLDGSGGKGAWTQQVVADMLSRFNYNTKITADVKGDAAFKSGNNAVVMLTAELGPFSRRGSKIDVTVSALDDATSLMGGTLLQTPLKGAARPG